MAEHYFEGIGRRKESTARVRLSSGSGNFIVNEKEAKEYFPRLGDMQRIVSALQQVDISQSTLDISAIVSGGGVSGQRDAIRLGIARALLLMNPELRPPLRKGGFLTRDSRVKERKKPGLKRARKAPTYTKR